MVDSFKNKQTTLPVPSHMFASSGFNLLDVVKLLSRVEIYTEYQCTHLTIRIIRAEVAPLPIPGIVRSKNFRRSGGVSSNGTGFYLPGY